MPLLQQALGNLLVSLDYDEIGLPGCHLSYDPGAHSSRAADDEMISQFADLLEHLSPPEHEFRLNKRLRNDRESITHGAQANDYQDDSEEARPGGHSGQFSVTDRCQGVNRHVEAIKPRPLADKPISDRSTGNDKSNCGAGQANLLVRFQSSLLHAFRDDTVSRGPKGFK